MKKIWHFIILLLLFKAGQAQSLLEKNQMIKGSGWKEENEVFFANLPQISQSFSILPAFMSDTMLSKKKLPDINNAFNLLRTEIIRPLFDRQNILIENTKTDSTTLTEKFSSIEKNLSAIDETISFVTRMIDSTNKKDIFLTNSFLLLIQSKKDSAGQLLSLLRNNYRDRLITLLSSLRSVLISDTMKYMEYKSEKEKLLNIDSLLQEAKNNLQKTIAGLNSLFSSIDGLKIRFADASKIDKKQTDQNLSVLPALSAKLGKRELLPNITLLGSALLGKEDNIYGDIRLFTGAGGNPKNLVTLENLLFQEFSAFGVTSNFTFSFFPAPTQKSKNKVGLNFGVNYLGKNLQQSDTSDFNTSVFQFKAGCEFAIDPERLSLYINFNRLTVADNVQKFEKEFGLKNKLFGFTEFGAKFQLSMLQNNNTFLDIDLGFIANANDVKLISKTSDLVIPRIKIGIKQKLIK